MVLLSAWPIVSTPVTLGGGRATLYAGRELAGSAWPTPAASHAALQRGSISDGVKRSVVLPGAWSLTPIRRRPRPGGRGPR